MTSAHAQLPNPRVRWVDALRGIAALVVAFHHLFVLFNDAFQAWEPFVPKLVALAHAISEMNVHAVTLFFILSGFSITLASQALDFRIAHDVQAYAYRRARRLLPLYWLALGFSGAVAWLVYPSADRSLHALTLLGNLVFLQSPNNIPGMWFPPYAENGPLWSLAPEVFYYVVFPVTLRCATRPRGALLIALSLTLASLAANQLLRNPIAQFGIGYVVWFSGVELARQQLRLEPAIPWTWWAAGVVAMELCVWFRPSASLSWVAGGIAMYLVAAWLLSVSPRTAAIPREPLSRVMQPFVWLGGISYALYLLHYPILKAFSLLFPHTGLMMLCATLVCIGVAWGAERWAATVQLTWLKRWLGVAGPVR